MRQLAPSIKYITYEGGQGSLEMKNAAEQYVDKHAS